MPAANAAPITGASPTVSPDGKRVAYTVSGHLVVSALDGAGAKTIVDTMTVKRPNWRGDGALIAFDGTLGAKSCIYVVRPDGTGLKAITKGPSDSTPIWSPRPFGLLRPSDISQRTILGRSKANLSTDDLSVLSEIAKNGDAYPDQFNIKPIAKYYKLLFLTQVGGRRILATIREDGERRQLLDTAIPGSVTTMGWQRSALSVVFGVSNGPKSAIYMADYPMIVDQNEDEQHPKFGVDLKQFQKSVVRMAKTQAVEFVGFTPNGEYAYTVNDKSISLIPVSMDVKGEALKVSIPTRAVSTLSWMPDYRHAVAGLKTGAAFSIDTVDVSGAGPIADIENVTDFDELTKPLRPLLAKNGFVAGGSPQKQMYQVYETTDYSNLPVMITTDSLLHTHHMLFDYLLRTTESEKLMPATIGLIHRYLVASLEQAKSTNPDVASAAKANATFFAVAARLALGEVRTGAIVPPKADPSDPLAEDRAAWQAKQNATQTGLLRQWNAQLVADMMSVPPDVNALASSEIALIKAHDAPSASPLFGGGLKIVLGGDMSSDTRIDYTDFIPRGHYTRGEILRRYFLVSRWMQNGPFRRNPELTRRALLIVAATDIPTLAAWNRIHNVVDQFVGRPDDDDLVTYTNLAGQVYDIPLTTEAVGDNDKLTAFLAKVNALPPPRIAPVRGPSFRFFPPPYTADSEVTQKMAYNGADRGVGTDNQPRYFSLGLDVMGAFGSLRALDILSETSFQGEFFDFKLKETEYAKYGDRMGEARKWLSSWTEADWNRNLYTRTLACFVPLLSPNPADGFKFTQTAAWTDKQLNTALATWAELKHDTMPKQPMVVEAGGEGGISETPLYDQPVGFVEPTPAVYARLLSLADAEAKVLADPAVGTPALLKRVKAFRDLVAMVQSLEAKQRTGTPFNARETEQMRLYGAYLEHLTLITADGQQGSMDNNDMAVIADVATAYASALNTTLALEEGVGRAVPIYAAIERNGHRILTRGAGFTYYEFTHPADDRLTDEKWREMLDDDKRAPKPPKWTSSFMGPLEP
jgi:hypothetical protein